MGIIQVIKDQKTELQEQMNNKKLFVREIESSCISFRKSKLIKIVTGVRRSGKSVLLYNLLKGVSFAYLNFDDDRLLSINPEEILPAFYEVYGKDITYLFLDEVQNVSNWELFVNRLYRNGFNIFITGSNAKLLSKELATHLTGRHLSIELFPFSFKEFLDTISFNENLETTKGISLLKHELDIYITNGGFPEIIIEKENPKLYLRELYRKIIERDIITRYNINYKKTFQEIAMHLLSNTGRIISSNSIKKQFGLGSSHTAKNYISYLEETYLILPISKFSYKARKIEQSEKKIYSIDTGLIIHAAIQNSRNYGSLYENIVAIELLRRRIENNDSEIYYYKDYQNNEVDFVIKNDLKIQLLMQVCYDITDQKTKQREVRSLLSASKELKCKNLLIITADKAGDENVTWYGITRKITYIPLWKWLLEKDLDKTLFN